MSNVQIDTAKFKLVQFKIFISWSKLKNLRVTKIRLFSYFVMLKDVYWKRLSWKHCPLLCISREKWAHKYAMGIFTQTYTYMVNLQYQYVLQLPRMYIT